MIRMQRPLIASLMLLCLLCSAVCLAQKPRPRKYPARREIIAAITTPDEPPMSPEAKRRFDTFVAAWTTIRDNYFDPTYSGLNWDNIRKEFEPRVKSARTDRDVHDLLNQMVGRLNRSHLAVIPPEFYHALEKTKADIKAKEKELASKESEGKDAAKNVNEDSGDELDLDDLSTRYGIGVELQLIGDRFVITRVDENSAAEYAGLKPGYILDKVNGVSLQEMLDRIQIYYAAFRANANIKQFIPAEIVARVLNGEKDSYLTIGYINEKEEAKEARIRRERLRDKAFTIAPNFPEQQVRFESRSLGSKIGYIRFNFFTVPIIGKFCDAIAEHHDRSALIIDLRGNGGGVLASIPALAGMLTEKPIDLGSMIYRTRTEPFTVKAREKRFQGRVIILINDSTASAAEVFAMGLRDNGRALIVGQRSSGEALPSMGVPLPTGAVLLYPFANYKSFSGRFIEGTGVEPDTIVSIDRKTLLEKRDLQLETAIGLATDDAAFAKLKPVEPAVNTGNSVFTIVGSPPPPPPKKAPPALAVPGGFTGPVNTGTGGLARKVDEIAGVSSDARKYVDDFLVATGGREALKNVTSYALSGKTKLSAYSINNDFSYNAFRERPSKYAETLSLPSTGEIREIFDGKKHFVQTDYGLDVDLPMFVTAEQTDPLEAIFELVGAEETFSSLSYKGTFDREGRKVALLEGTTKGGSTVAYAFDIQTKLLVNASRPLISVTLKDYRKVGALSLPFNIERSALMSIQLSSISINPPIDAAKFGKKVNCYDIPLEKQGEHE